MKVFKLRNNIDKYQVLQLDTMKIVEQLEREDLLSKIKRLTTSNNSPIASDWIIIKSEFVPVRGAQAKEIPDVSVWKGTGLVFSGKAHSIFKSKLEPFGEFLPIDAGGKTFFLFHLMTEGKVDLSNSSRKDDEFGEPMEVTALKFEDTDIEAKLLFKSEYAFYQAPFCNQKFKELYESHNLEGLFFEEDLCSKDYR